MRKTTIELLSAPVGVSDLVGSSIEEVAAATGVEIPALDLGKAGRSCYLLEYRYEKTSSTDNTIHILAAEQKK